MHYIKFSFNQVHLKQGNKAIDTQERGNFEAGTLLRSENGGRVTKKAADSD